MNDADEELNVTPAGKNLKHQLTAIACAQIFF
jgi:hypothetical protein